MTEQEKLAHCSGCRDDFYNHGGNGMGGGKCWNLKSAKLVTRFRTHRDDMPATYGAFKQVKVFNCYGGSPWYYQTAVPDFVRMENVINSPEWKRKQASRAKLAPEVGTAVRS